MKSKKIVALIVAFAAFMAVATSGLAAVTTTTTYNAADATKVLVDVEVTEVSGEVTYLVKSGTQIVYIDQATAEDGKVDFEYKISKEKMSGIQTEVKFGTDAGTPITGYAEALPFNEVTDSGNNYTIAYYRNMACAPADEIEGIYAGTEDEIYAVIEPAEGFTIKSVTGATAVEAGSKVYKLNDGVYTIAVETEAVVTTPVVVPSITPGTGTIVENETIVEGEKTYFAKTTLLKVDGSKIPERIGVVYNGDEYDAVVDDNGSMSYVAGQLYAVRIITEDNEVIDLTPFYYVDGQKVVIE